MNFIIVQNVFLLLVICVCNKSYPTGLLQNQGILVFYSWKSPLTRSKYTFPIHTRTTSYANFKNLLHIRDIPTKSSTKEPFIGGESDVPWKERRDKFWIVGSRLRPYGDFSKHSRKSHTVPEHLMQTKSREKSTYTS